ncbi:unnamed protein product [Ectocarpus sp. 8 AP-2014]
MWLRHRSTFGAWEGIDGGGLQLWGSAGGRRRASVFPGVFSSLFQHCTGTLCCCCRNVISGLSFVPFDFSWPQIVQLLRVLCTSRTLLLGLESCLVFFLLLFLFNEVPHGILLWAGLVLFGAGGDADACTL